MRPMPSSLRRPKFRSTVEKGSRLDQIIGVMTVVVVLLIVVPGLRVLTDDLPLPPGSGHLA